MEQGCTSIPTWIYSVDGILVPESDARESSDRFTEVPRTRNLESALSEMRLDHKVVFGEARGMGRVGYVAFYISSLKKAVLVCNEKNNTTFVISNVLASDLKSYIFRSKNELQLLKKTGVVDTMADTESVLRWKKKMRRLLETQKNDIVDNVDGFLAAQKMENPPNREWMAIKEVLAHLGISRERFEDWFDEIEEDTTRSPEAVLFEYYLDYGSRLRLYYSPYAIKRMAEKKQSLLRELPAGAMKMEDVLGRYKVTRNRDDFHTRIAERGIADEKRYYYYDDQGRETEYCPKEMVEALDVLFSDRLELNPEQQN